jgi:hypothetical protein
MEQIVIGNLTNLQAEELKHLLLAANIEPDGVSLGDDSSQLERDRHGLPPDLMTIFVQVTPAVLAVLGIWLAKTRVKDKFKFCHKAPDGTVTCLEIGHTGSEAQAASAEITRALLANGIPIPPDTTESV